MREPGGRAIVSSMLLWGWFAIAYGALSVFAVAVGYAWHGEWPLFHRDPWLPLPAPLANAYGLLLGCAFAGLVVVATRISVQRFFWARRLHRELQPFARAISSTGVVSLALLSASGEELFFRGLLQPSVGLLLQALIFGFLHQLPGPSRWVWASWAAAVGLALGALFQLTGTLLGPIAAHALINGMNLAYLKHHDPEPQHRAVGGLFGERG